MNPAGGNLSVTGVTPQTPVPLSSDPLRRQASWGGSVPHPLGKCEDRGQALPLRYRPLFSAFFNSDTSFKNSHVCSHQIQSYQAHVGIDQPVLISVCLREGYCLTLKDRVGRDGE